MLFVESLWLAHGTCLVQFQRGGPNNNDCRKDGEKKHFDWYLVQKRPNGIMLFVEYEVCKLKLFLPTQLQSHCFTPCMCTCVK